MKSDRKILIQKAAVGVLAAVFIVNLILTKKKMEENTAPAEKALEMALNIGENEEALMTETVGKKILYKGDTGRNPLMKPSEVVALEEEGLLKFPGTGQGETGEGVEKLTLEGIIWGDGEKLAIISGEVLAEGETYGNVRVLYITEDEVTVLENGTKIILRMKR
ncbi:MAG: hypothetical protein JW994_06495 [Candidatus Omnitrophica bacterium]|nr:hypothetical protein [Candidatus Omnitrophota bacterium]